jgi:hypothetical protein
VSQAEIPGYTYGTDAVARSPLSLEELELLQATLLLGEDDLAAVRRRFGRWIGDTARATFDRAWLDYQHEIGLRHHRSGKNRTDGARAADHIPLRYVLALLVPITTTLKPFLADGAASDDEVEAMHQAWVKAVLLQVILWSHPYVRDGDF